MDDAGLISLHDYALQQKAQGNLPESWIDVFYTRGSMGTMVFMDPTELDGTNPNGRHIAEIINLDPNIAKTLFIIIRNGKKDEVKQLEGVAQSYEEYVRETTGGKKDISVRVS